MDYIVGGYYLIQGAPLQSWMNARLLPPLIWSASRCICEKIPDAWIFPWNEQPDPTEDRMKYKHALDLTDVEFSAIQSHFDRYFGADEFGYPNVYMSLSTAHKAYSRFFSKLPNLKLISIAIPETEAKQFVDHFQPFGNVAENGVRKKLRQQQKVEPFASPIGFDVIGYDWADFESFICASLEEEIISKYMVRFNRWGFIDSHAEAQKIVQEIRSGAISVEQGYWAAWLISEYSLD